MNKSQLDVTNCDNLTCHICYPEEEITTFEGGVPYTKERHQRWEKDAAKKLELLLEGNQQAKKMALELKKMYENR